MEMVATQFIAALYFSEILLWGPGDGGNLFGDGGDSLRPWWRPDPDHVRYLPDNVHHLSNLIGDGDDLLGDVDDLLDDGGLPTNRPNVMKSVAKQHSFLEILSVYLRFI